MRKYLLPSKKQYKANLHAHTTISDGVYTAEELKTLYKEQGYSILAYTDHEILVPHLDLQDKDFLPLTGYEVQIYGDMHLPKRLRRVCHINFIAKEANHSKMPFFNLEEVLRLDKRPDISKAVYDGDGKDYKEYSAKGINDLIKKGTDSGFIVGYNHPTWSKEDASVYTNLKGLYAMEIFNNGVEVLGFDAYCPYIYEEMLRSGQKLGCIATDDCHKSADLFGGFTYVLANELSYEAVIKALENGDFYASRGPVIKSLWYEEGVFHIECSPVKQIVVSNSCRRPFDISVKKDEKGNITSAEFPICEMDNYVAFTITDKDGKTANTRAYWREEFESTKAVAEFVPRKIKGE